MIKYGIRGSVSMRELELRLREEYWLREISRMMLMNHIAMGPPLPSPETEEKAKTHKDTVDNTVDYTTPTTSSSNVEPQAASLPCQSAQQRVREEAERIKHSYDHDVEKHGRDWPIVYGFKTPEMVEKYLMPSQYREINKAITQAYADLVTDAPYLPWAKVGHVVTAQFGCRMKDMEVMSVPIDSPSELFENAIRAIGEGNIRIFDGLYPTMRLVADVGVDKFLECAKNGHFGDSVPEELIAAIEELQGGDFAEAEAMIVKYEQKKIAPPIYREFKQQYEFMQDMAAQARKYSFGIVDPQSVLPVTHCIFPPGSSWEDVDSVSMDGSLFNEDDRVEFYKKLAPYVYKNYGR